MAFILWLGLVAAGYSRLLKYSFRDGGATAAPRTLPLSLAGGTPLERPQIFLALHPRCPCSRATMHELEKILTRAPNRADVTVLMFQPAAVSASWTEGALLDECRRLNCRIRPDPDGALASSLGSLTSGALVLYDASGHLRYRGGITSARGHEGDNPGASAVIEVLTGLRESLSSMPVFGCPISELQTNSVPAPASAGL